MINKVYSLKDNKTGEFAAPIFVGSDVVCKRYFMFKLQSDEYLRSFFEDFTVYLIGQYDTESGQIQSCVPQLVFNLSDLNQAEEKG